MYDIKNWQFGTEPTYHTLYTCSQDSTQIYDCINIAFCIKMVNETPMTPML